MKEEGSNPHKALLENTKQIKNMKKAQRYWSIEGLKYKRLTYYFFVFIIPKNQMEVQE